MQFSSPSYAYTILIPLLLCCMHFTANFLNLYIGIYTPSPSPPIFTVIGSYHVGITCNTRKKSEKSSCKEGYFLYKALKALRKFGVYKILISFIHLFCYRINRRTIVYKSIAYFVSNIFRRLIRHILM